MVVAVCQANFCFFLQIVRKFAAIMPVLQSASPSFKGDRNGGNAGWSCHSSGCLGSFIGGVVRRSFTAHQEKRGEGEEGE